MGAPVATVGSIINGTCPCHISPVGYTSVIVTGAPTVNTNGVPTANASSIGISSCGHPTVSITFSSTVIANGGGVHHLGDIAQNCGAGITITGSPNVNAG